MSVAFTKDILPVDGQQYIRLIVWGFFNLTHCISFIYNGPFKKYFVIYLFMYRHCNSPKQFAVIEYYSGKKKKASKTPNEHN